tara:strand:+ start:11867 stop:12130 length:264 start_codon:yes stop_codon:yes gene_type:complete
MNINKCIISISMGILTYILLYINNLHYINDKTKFKNDISLKIPAIISLSVLIILNTFCTTFETINIDTNINKKNLEIFTDNNYSNWL